MRIRTTLTTLTLAAAMIAAPGTVMAQAAKGPRVIALVGTDNLQFSLTTITAKPGEALRVTLDTKSMQPKTTMAHNFVLLAPGVEPSGFAMAAAMARSTEYIPAAAKDKILVATRLAGAGETVSADFKAPTKPGRYIYICTFPGHVSGGMKGVLIVK